MGKKIVLVGAGHALLPSLIKAKEWVAQGAEIVLVTADPYLYYSGMLPEWFGGVYTLDEIRIPVQELAEQSGIKCYIDNFKSIDTGNKQIETQKGIVLEYDVVAFAIGGTTSAKIPKAFAVKPFTELIQLKTYIESNLHAKSLHIGVVGGGAAGVELSLNLSARYSNDLVQLTILDSNDRLVHDFPRAVSRFCQEVLKERGVRFQLKAQKGKVDYSVFDKLINATGVSGSEKFKSSDLALSLNGYIRVNRFLQSISHKDVFAAGDCATVQDMESLPKIGVHAVTQGAVLCDNLESYMVSKKIISKGRLEFRPFKPRKIEGLILSTGSPYGIWSTKRVSIIHPIMLQLKHEVDLRWIRTYQPKFEKLSLFERLHHRYANQKNPILSDET